MAHKRSSYLSTPARLGMMLLLLSVALAVMYAPATGAPVIGETLSAGDSHTCAVKTDGSLICWGDNTYGQVSGPNGSSDTFTQVSAGYYHTCAVKTEGTLACWGLDSPGLLPGTGSVSGPDGASGFTQVASGLVHTCGLKTDGSVTCWGTELYGQVGSFSSPPVGSSYIQISVGVKHSCGVTTDLALECWGTDMMFSVSGPNLSSDTFTQVSAGGGLFGSTCGLKTDGSLACWGFDYYGSVSGPNGSSGFTQVAAGDFHTCGVKTDGSLQCWGDDGFPLSGRMSGPNGSSDIFTQIAPGLNHTCGQKAVGGAVVCWGSDAQGQSSPPDDYFAFPSTFFLDKTADPSIYVPYHGVVTYTVLFDNPTVFSDTNAFLTDTLPVELDFGGWSEQPSGASVASDEITWNGTITTGESITFTFTATHVGGYCEIISNTAEYSGTLDASPVITMRLTDRSYFIVCADLEIAKTVTPTTVNPGWPVTYTLAFSNTGSAPAPNVVISDSVPVSVTNPLEFSPNCSMGAQVNARVGPTFIWDVASLQPGEMCVITITGDLSDTLPGLHVFTNTATITSTDISEFNVANNDDGVEVTVNAAPVADADGPRYPSLGDPVQLDGSGSDDPDDHHLPLAYGWKQIGSDPPGQSVTFDGSVVSPTFTAPDLWTGILTFTLTVTDALGLADSTPDVVTVTVQNVPVAGLAVVNSSPTLLGRTTYFTAEITNGSSVTYTWNFADGDVGYSDDLGHISYSDHDYSPCGLPTTYYNVVVTATNSFITGTPSALHTYTDTETTVVTITNNYPVADAVGPDRPAVVGSLVTLDGSGSYDPDSPYNDIVEYGWEQTGGITATLSDSSAISPTFTAPQAFTMPTVITFTLTVTDTGCLTGTDIVAVTVVMPVGGYTEIASPSESLELWLLLLAAMITTGAIATIALKRRMA